MDSETITDTSMLDIVLWPDRRLSKACKPVPDDDFGTQELLNQVGNMIYTMIGNEGIGLAANQVGFENRVLIISKEPESPNGLPLVCINPKITNRSSTKQTMKEGCLSFPEQTSIRRRSKRVTFKAQDLYGTTFTWTARELQAQCFQHELDHLNGKTFFDK